MASSSQFNSVRSQRRNRHRDKSGGYTPDQSIGKPDRTTDAGTRQNKSQP